ncbi:MAG: SufE family protein [Cellvibrionaceae bacterium]|nr:SufE family protein [Cellvibrionaceae bacterium]
MNESIKSNPFGSSITASDILDTLNFFDNWEERYKYVIDLGKELPKMDDSFKDELHLVKGCQSQVWIHGEFADNKLWLIADSDAFIVKGLLGVVLAAFNGQAPEYIRTFDVEDYFSKLGLMRHLSASRGNGLRAMVLRIKQMAQAF